MNFEPRECDMDLVVDMERANIGVEEILQYAAAVFTEDDIRSLIYALEQKISHPVGAEHV